MMKLPMVTDMPTQASKLVKHLPSIDDVMLGNTLPNVEDVGDAEASWHVPIVDSDFDIAAPNSDDIVLCIQVHGQFVGMGSTQRLRHNSHAGEYADTSSGEKCNACRWFELRLFYDDEERRYILHFAGRSVVPDETQRFRVEHAYSAYEVIEILSSQQRSNRTMLSTEDGTPLAQNPTSSTGTLTYPAIRALSQACGFDDDIKEAYEGRRAKV